MLRPPADKDRWDYEVCRWRRGIMLPTGIAFMLLGFSFASFAALLPPLESETSYILSQAISRVIGLVTREVIDTEVGQTHALASLALIIFIVIGFWLATRSQDDHHEFMKAHEHLSLEYSPAERKRFKLNGLIYFIVGLGFLGFCVVFEIIVAEGDAGIREVVNTLNSEEVRLSAMREIHSGIFFGIGAISAWLIVHGSITWLTPDIFIYNYEALKFQSIYEIDTKQSGLRRVEHLEQKRICTINQTINRAILVVVVIWGFVLYFLPGFESPFYWAPAAAGWILSLFIDRACIDFAERRTKEIEDNKEAQKLR